MTIKAAIKQLSLSCIFELNPYHITYFLLGSKQEAAQALIYAGMAGSKLENIQDKVNEYLDRVQTLLNAGQFT